MLQLEHTLEDPTAAWKRPAGQLLQVVAPAVAENWPAAQDVHSKTLLEIENWPAAHEAHELPDTNVPGAQFTEEHDEAPDAVNLPTSQATQVPEEGAPLAAEYVPAVHALHEVAPLLA